jgi:hypothetical protein
VDVPEKRGLLIGVSALALALAAKMARRSLIFVLGVAACYGYGQPPETKVPELL